MQRVRREVVWEEMTEKVVVTYDNYVSIGSLKMANGVSSGVVSSGTTS
jgi:hypothetical protein